MVINLPSQQSNVQKKIENFFFVISLYSFELPPCLVRNIPNLPMNSILFAPKESYSSLNINSTQVHLFMTVKQSFVMIYI